MKGRSWTQSQFSCCGRSPQRSYHKKIVKLKMVVAWSVECIIMGPQEQKKKKKEKRGTFLWHYAASMKSKGY
ncbi:hypothetical protein SELMODRAFT_448972 [Selaginella moellendorffii]|uniref:Uncharacterized protein n=1 Tax=Selaginella moellendorffii TaxID=88036 RepID=D8TBP7_SELML|nr:hypothetical protein SELMODRAFT_448972 [Selaginella moellendorffii]